MRFLSRTSRSDSGPGASSTATHRKGILPITSLTCLSSCASDLLSSGDTDVRSQVSRSPGALTSLELISAVPTCFRKIDARWFPPPVWPTFPAPLCYLSRDQRFVLAPRLRACVPTRTTRNVADSCRCSPFSKKSYTPRHGQPWPPWQSTSRE